MKTKITDMEKTPRGILACVAYFLILGVGSILGGLNTSAQNLGMILSVLFLLGGFGLLTRRKLALALSLVVSLLVLVGSAYLLVARLFSIDVVSYVMPVVSALVIIYLIKKRQIFK